MTELHDPASSGLTPLRRQYLRVKKQFPDAIVLFRLGDFYETFDGDAEITARELEIVLTGREMGKGQRVPMAGIPYHALDSYLAKLVRRGHKVAICEQLTDPAMSKGLVERDVVRVVTPGTVLEPALLEQKANNYLMAIAPLELSPSPTSTSLNGRGDRVGLAYADITTGEFAVTQMAAERISLEMERLNPAEVLVAKGGVYRMQPLMFRQSQDERDIPGAAVTELEARDFDTASAQELLQEHFGVMTLAGFGLDGMPLAVSAAGALVAYLQRTQKAALTQLSTLRTYTTERIVPLDPQTRRNLELFQAGRSGTGKPLLTELDTTKTPMGGRLLRAWLGQPLYDLEELRHRQHVVQWFFGRALVRDQVSKLLGRIMDIERLVTRVQTGIALPRELVALRRSLEALPEVKGTLATEGFPDWLLSDLRPCDEVAALLAKAIVEEPVAPLGDGGVIREGFSPDLDQLRAASRDATGYLAGLEQRERERAGIPLKVGYNRVFGYYIEVSKAHAAKVPPDFIRRQTLVNGERYITPELKEHEATVLGAQERMAERESALFRQVCKQVADSAARLLATARAVAHVDVFLSFADVAARRGYCRPELNDGTEIRIKAGRHPVVERLLPQGTFVPNDLELGSPECSLIILTGPNMAGKSTFLRQTELIVLMAQVGSFVPADEATIGLVDRIFTRVGLQDDLTTGMSTFMLEMVETAHILNNATAKSLVILDEIGRGTSTYDGLAIARAVAEHLHNSPKLGCKTLFATHYHELTELASANGGLPRVRNFNVSAVEQDGKLVFLHSLRPGGADRSYGVHVAQLAGLPKPVVQRAEEVLSQLESGQGNEPSVHGPTSPSMHTGPASLGTGRTGKGSVVRNTSPQLPLLPSNEVHPAFQALMELDLNAMTPLEALNKLAELQRQAKRGK
ncbi:MAG: DNA mismatch repair protein MutS [Dehalococcoidia bacterium]|nr:DNA mismatch repair protein MutS [Dehalococcoidia bacterium]